MQLLGSLVHLEYSASYLISCRDSGKPTETNLDVHRFRYLIYCESGTKNGTVLPLGDSLVHLEYSATYLISCRDSGKPTETNLDIHRFEYLVYCERGT